METRFRFHLFAILPNTLTELCVIIIIIIIIIIVIIKLLLLLLLLLFWFWGVYKKCWVSWNKTAVEKIYERHTFWTMAAQQCRAASASHADYGYKLERSVASGSSGFKPTEPKTIVRRPTKWNGWPLCVSDVTAAEPSLHDTSPRFCTVYCNSSMLQSQNFVRRIFRAQRWDGIRLHRYTVLNTHTLVT